MSTFMEPDFLAMSERFAGKVQSSLELFVCSPCLMFLPDDDELFSGSPAIRADQKWREAA